MTRMSESKFIRKSIKKILLTKKGGQEFTKSNLSDNVFKIGFWVGKICRVASKSVEGYTSKEVAEVMEAFNKGFLEGGYGDVKD